MYCTRTRWCVQGAVGHQPQRKGTADRYVSDLVENYPSAVKNSTQVPTAVMAPTPNKCRGRKHSAVQPGGLCRDAIPLHSLVIEWTPAVPYCSYV